MDLTEKARKAYFEMVAVMEKEVGELPRPHMMTAPGGAVYPVQYAHLGHSRTPSACSAISFASSILSEPISENYPHSEPETDSRGYDIVKNPGNLVDAKQRDGMPILAPKTAEVYIENDNDHNDDDEDDDDDSQSEGSPNSISGKITIVERIDEIDEGHEADTEDINDSLSRQNSEAIYSQDDENEQDTIPDLRPVDSVHSSIVDLNAEILSQHSSKTVDLTAEVLSTHSSKTLGENNLPSGSESASRRSPIADSKDTAQVNSSGLKVRMIDKDRIESWVADTQHQMERLNIDNDKKMDFIHKNKLTVEDKKSENTSPTCCKVCDTQS